ncbi:hypothetical protein NM208_g426 [Fusarium decemcellulare]|uniref:Uncharacterized protein n=1 Tax=Fusarium decemcellulare TaxID=57161 RepID=A0ACC1SZM6_9HYPO|nr:hypothetical protein NM208_g426 [Fusarium decemcellulare]
MEKDPTTTVDPEKVDDKFVEHAPNPYLGLSPEDADFMGQYEGQAGKKVVRKIDFRLIPIMAILYLLAHIDRGNIGNAKIEGMDKDLGLTGNQYNIASTIFFVPYIIFDSVKYRSQENSTKYLAIIPYYRLGHRHDLPASFLGQCLLSRVGIQDMSFSNDLPFSTPPRPSRVPSVAFSPLALREWTEPGGIAGWRWIFLIEGAVTVAAGLVMPLLIIDTPERAKWLSDDEKRFIDLRLRLSGVRANTDEGDKFSWKLLLRTMVDWKILLGIILAWANSVPNAAFKFTMPQIIKQLGFSTAQSQLLTMPPYVCGGISAWLSGRFSDRFSWRMPFIVGPMSVLLVALAVLFKYSENVADSVPAMYTGVVLAQIGIYPLLPGISAWTGNNLAPSWKRSIGLAWLLAAGNLGSIIGTNIFLDKEGPRYPTGYGTSLGIICLGVSTALVMEFFLWRLNKTKAQNSEIEVRQKYSQEQLDSMGERSPLYQYTL